MIKKLYFIVFALTLLSCNQKRESEANTNFLYFDIKGYFKNESIRLQHLNPVVNKLVSTNGIEEKKSVKIANWEKELGIFADADINKTSWKGSFKEVKTTGNIEYTSLNKKIAIKNIFIGKNNDKVNKIEIIIANKNILYTSNDTLIYYPDSLYQINKQQKIRFLKAKKYLIIAKLK